MGSDNIDVDNQSIYDRRLRFINPSNCKDVGVCVVSGLGSVL